MENKIEQLELLGDRVIILLDKAKDHTVTEAGIILPLFDNKETDGGKPGQELSKRKYLSVGTVLGISPLAQEKLPTLSVNDRVYVASTAVSPNYQFLPDRTQLVEDWTGLISVSHLTIEAKLKQV